MEQGNGSGSASSNSVGMVSTKCDANMSQNDQDCTILSQEDVARQKKQPTVKKQKVLTSAVWEHFDRIKTETEEGTNKIDVICKYCHQKFNGASDQGTTHLKNHAKSCRMRIIKVPISQRLLGKKVSSEDSQPKLGVHKFDHATERALYAKMIAKHDLSFSMAEYDYFHLWISYVMPSYKHRTRKTVKSDLVDVYTAEKERIYNEIKNLNCRVSLTTDGWKPKHQNRSYFCVTCHYIDDLWVLHKWIISFRVVPYPHQGVNLSEWLKERILEWNIDKKLSSVVVDNASNNSGMLSGIKPWLNGKKALVHNGDMFHMRCVPHILNLIVKSGLEMLDPWIEKIQKTAKYIGSSAHRDEKFTIALSQTKLNTMRRIPLDVDTRWNSTYEMLVASLELRPAIERLKELDNEYKFLPSEIEWENGKKVCECLKIFSDITKKHSGVKYPTANLYFIDVIQIRRSIKIWAESSDEWINLMASKMQLKFDKYWDECNKLLTVAVVLDPRYKMIIVSFAYKGIYDHRADFYVEEVREFLLQIFNEYSDQFGKNGEFVESSRSGSGGMVGSSAGGEWLGGFQDFVVSNNLGEHTKKSELDEYLKEGLFSMDNGVEFDILNWWKLNGPKFPILARMARDILAIPTSSVASENSFSKCRRIITDTRSSLHSESVETLMCVKDWLPDIKDGHSEKDFEHDSSVPFDSSYSDWDLDF